MGIVVYYISGYAGTSLSFIATIPLIALLSVGIPLFIIGLRLWVHSGRLKWKQLVVEEELFHTELKEKIYNYLKDNGNKAFTIKVIMDRLFSDSPTEVSKEMVKQSLENLVKQGEIQRTEKDTEIFYLY